MGGAIVSKRAVWWFTLSQFSSIESEATRVECELSAPLISPIGSVFRWTFAIRHVQLTLTGKLCSR